jgi:hypothetical protein
MVHAVEMMRHAVVVVFLDSYEREHVAVRVDNYELREHAVLVAEMVDNCADYSHYVDFESLPVAEIEQKKLDFDFGWCLLPYLHCEVRACH